MAAKARTAKDEVRELLDQMPESATIEDIAYELELRARIRRGLADSEAGRGIPVAEVRRRLGLGVD